MNSLKKRFFFQKFPCGAKGKRNRTPLFATNFTKFKIKLTDGNFTRCKYLILREWRQNARKNTRHILLIEDHE